LPSAVTFELMSRFGVESRLYQYEHLCDNP
jgi:hypothetical protein